MNLVIKVLDSIKYKFLVAVGKYKKRGRPRSKNNDKT